MGKGARRGIRTEAGGSAFFWGSVVQLILGLGYLSMVVKNRSNMSLILASPVVLLSFYPIALERVRRRRADRVETDAVTAKILRTDLAWLRAGVYTAGVATAAAVAAFVIFWGFELANMAQ